MAKSRKQVINHNDGVYPYHLIQTCSRNNFLCGYTPAGYDRSYRRRRIEKRMFFLHSVLSVDMIAYGIQHNHYHLIVLPNLERAKAWSDQEVVRRWFCLYNYKNYPYVKQWYDSQSEQDRTVHVKRTIRSWREQLTYISKFMALLNYAISVQANKEDRMTGSSFWERRYKAYRLQEQSDLIQCMTYNDLNPVRAGIADTPEDSMHTSLYQRIHQDISSTHQLIEGTPEFDYDRLNEYGIELKPLMPLNSWDNNEVEWGIACDFEAYKELVDWTGRAIRPEKRGYIDNSLPPIAQRLAPDKQTWLQQITQHDRRRHTCNIEAVNQAKKQKTTTVS